MASQIVIPQGDFGHGQQIAILAQPNTAGGQQGQQQIVIPTQPIQGHGQQQIVIPAQAIQQNTSSNRR